MSTPESLLTGLQSVLAAIPQWMVDLGAAVGVCAAVIGLFVALSKLSVIKKLISRNVTTPLQEWIGRGVNVALTPDRERQHHFQEYVRHHLGPNGLTPPIYKRLENLEQFSVVASERQRRVLDAVSVGISESGPDGECNYVNRYMCDLMECDAADWYGQGWKAFLYPPEKANEIERWEFALENEQDNPTHVMHFVTKRTKSVIEAEAYSYPLINGHGELIGFVGEVRPIQKDDVCE